MTKEELDLLQEQVCVKCDHYAIRGYIYCICCLHGHCSVVPQELMEELRKHRRAQTERILQEQYHELSFGDRSRD